MSPHSLRGRASLARVLIVFVIAAAGLSGLPGRADDATAANDPSELALWQKVSALDAAGKDGEALQALQAQPAESSGYYYNLGTLELKLGQIGYALAHLEKANHLKPHDPAIQHNLQIARSSLGGALGINRLDPASTWSEEIAERVTMEEVRGALGLLGSILVLIWLRSYLRSRRLRHTFLHPSAVLASLAFLITVGIYTAERLADEHPPAVALSRQVIRSGPGDHYIELAEIEPGVKLRILGPTETASAHSPAPPATGSAPVTDQVPGEIWRQVRYSQDGIGWVRASSLLLL